jgi:hypothetical protein
MSDTLTVKVEIDVQLICGMLDSGIEQGIRYWARDVRPAGSSEQSLDACPANCTLQAWYAVTGHETREHTTLIEHGGEGLAVEHVLTHEKIMQGLARFVKRYPRRFGQALSGRWDAEDGDVLIQLSLFGDTLKYG